MKRLLIILLVAVALVATALIAPILAEDPGYVQLDIGPWRIETSVLVLVGAVIATWLALSLLVLYSGCPHNSFASPASVARGDSSRRVSWP